MRTFAYGREARLRDTLLHKGIHDSLGPLLAQWVVHGIGAGVVAMALHLKLKLGMFLHQFGHTVDFNDGFWFQVGLSSLESDGVGNDFAVGGEAVVERHGTLGDVHIAQPRVAIATRG